MQRVAVQGPQGLPYNPSLFFRDVPVRYPVGLRLRALLINLKDFFLEGPANCTPHNLFGGLRILGAETPGIGNFLLCILAFCAPCITQSPLEQCLALLDLSDANLSNKIPEIEALIATLPPSEHENFRIQLSEARDEEARRQLAIPGFMRLEDVD